MKVSKKIQSGFTLTETIISIIIFVLIVISIFSIQYLSRQSFLEGEKTAEILQNGRVILERMVREIRQAKEIVTELSDDISGATTSIEFEDGHTPTKCPEIGSEYYYVRYFLSNSSEVKRQCLVYCFDDCGNLPNVCSNYYRWNNTRETYPQNVHPCILEEKIVGEYVNDLKFWGFPLINIFLTLKKDNKETFLKTQVLGRNL